MAKIRQPFGNDPTPQTPITDLNVGTAATGVTATEYGDAINHYTVLDVDAVLPAIAGGANLGVGVLLYTLPAGVQHVKCTHMSVAIKQTTDKITNDDPKVGIGSVIASGVVNVLSGTSTFMDYITQQDAADCDGEPTVKTALPTANRGKVIEAAGAKTIHFNAADGWAADGDPAAKVIGKVILEWTQIV